MVGIIVRVGRDGLPVPFGRPLEIRLLLAQEHRVESGDLGELGRVVAAGEEMSQMLELLLAFIYLGLVAGLDAGGDLERIDVVGLEVEDHIYLHDGSLRVLQSVLVDARELQPRGRAVGIGGEIVLERLRRTGEVAVALLVPGLRDRSVCRVCHGRTERIPVLNQCDTRRALGLSGAGAGRRTCRRSRPSARGRTYWRR